MDYFKRFRIWEESLLFFLNQTQTNQYQISQYLFNLGKGGELTS